MSKPTILRVKEATPLMDFLMAKMGGMSRTSVKSLLSHRQVQVNDHIETQFNYPLQTGDEVVITRGTANKELNHSKLRVVYEDDNLIVVEKREGILTMVATAESREVTVFSLLKNYVRKANPHGGIYVVHRLDRETSGLLVFAKNRDIQQFMRDNWHVIVTERTYVALVEGNMEKEEDNIVSWITENPHSLHVKNSFTDNGGKRSVTHYKTLRHNAQWSLLELHLETGRTHQIRVQMAGLKHPVVGDRKYGHGATPVIDRLALHASVLEFVHPMTKQRLRFETPIPKEFTRLFEKK